MRGIQGVSSACRLSWLGRRILSVPLSAQFCFSWWELGRGGWTRLWNTQIKVNPTQFHEQMGHPVVEWCHVRRKVLIAEGVV